MAKPHKLKPGWSVARMKEIIRTRIKSTGSFHSPYLLYGEENCCAVGAFIPPKFESQVKATGNNNVSILDQVPGLAGFMPLERDGLGGLMKAHDGAKSADPRDTICNWIDENVEEAVTV